MLLVVSKEVSFLDGCHLNAPDAALVGALDLVACEQRLQALYGCGHAALWESDPASYQCHDSKSIECRSVPVEGLGASELMVSWRMGVAAR